MKISTDAIFNRTNYEATKLAISRTMKGEPTIDELIANRKSVQHYALDGVLEP